MDALTYTFEDLGTVIEQVHALFDTWEKAEYLPPPIGLPTLYQLKLATHEWLANLVQHANFEQETTRVHLTARPVDERIHCIIIDNSDGFVLDMHLEIEPEYLDSLPERGMGLLILKICTEELLYQRDEEKGENRLEFYVSPEHENLQDIPNWNTESPSSRTAHG